MSTFVDTGPWYASIVPEDPHHASVLGWLRGNHYSLVTTDYVVDETLTLLRARGEKRRALALGRRFFDLGGVDIQYLSQEDVRKAWELFRDNPGRGWSFTDCTSRAAMERLHIKRVLTFDHHFAEFGGLEIVP